MKYHEFTAMNTSFLFAAEGDLHQVDQGFREAEELVHKFERKFTRFSDTSELAELNRSSGAWFAGSPDLFELVTLAYAAYQDTGGLFNPGILAALESSGYTRNMELIRGRSVPPASFTRNLTDTTALFGQIGFNRERQEIFLPRGLRIDLGGIAKGWIAQKAANHISRYAQACLVDSSGDLFTVGLPAAENFWRVAIEDPFVSTRDLIVLEVGPGAVSTTAITKRSWRQNGKVRHHLIDPRTALPAQPTWVSVSVVARHAHQAEALSKALLIGGPSAAPELFSCFPGAVYAAVDRHKKIWGNVDYQKVARPEKMPVR